MSVEPLDFSRPWPYPWSRREQLALEAGVSTERLRPYLAREVTRAQAVERPEESQEA